MPPVRGFLGFFWLRRILVTSMRCASNVLVSLKGLCLESSHFAVLFVYHTKHPMHQAPSYGCYEDLSYITCGSIGRLSIIVPVR